MHARDALSASLSFPTSLYGLNREHRLQQFLYCSALTVAAVTWLGCRGNVFTEPFPSNGRLFWLHNFDFEPSCHNMLRILLLLLIYIRLWYGKTMMMIMIEEIISKCRHGISIVHYIEMKLNNSNNAHLCTVALCSFSNRILHRWEN
jgi:hypothetical protein